VTRHFLSHPGTLSRENLSRDEQVVYCTVLYRSLDEITNNVFNTEFSRVEGYQFYPPGKH